MEYYSPKHCVIRAQQWSGPGHIVEGVQEERLQSHTLYFVETIAMKDGKHQRVYIDPGDYIIAEPDGKHYYPCKPQVFEKRWEKM